MCWQNISGPSPTSIKAFGRRPNPETDRCFLCSCHMSNLSISASNTKPCIGTNHQPFSIGSNFFAPHFDFHTITATIGHHGSFFTCRMSRESLSTREVGFFWNSKMFLKSKQEAKINIIESNCLLRWRVRELLRKEDSKQLKQQQCSNKEQEKNHLRCPAHLHACGHIIGATRVQDRFGKAQTLSNRADARGFEQVLKIGRATDEGAIRSDWQTRKKLFFLHFFCLHHFGA